jgi:hypothetical protein
VRLACVKRAASVDSEPGSNSRLNLLIADPLSSLLNCLIAPVLTQVTDDLFLNRAQRERCTLPETFYFASNQIVKDLRIRTYDLKEG